MSSWLIGAIGVVYLGVSVSLYLDGRPGLSLAFFGYALANVGLMIDAAK